MALRTLAMLARWSAQFPDTRMPDSLEGLPTAQHLHLQANDPELFSLLAGTANAELEMAALNGSLPDATLTPAQRQDATNAARIAELVAMNPFGTPGVYSEDGTYIPGHAGSLTGQFELAALDPQLAAQLKTAATPPAPQQGLTQEGANFVNQQLFAAHIAAGAA